MTSRFNKTNADSLLRRKSEILGVFTKTKEDLVKLNEDQEIYVSDLERKKLEIQNEQNIVSNSIAENSKIINKIADFLG